MRRAVNLTLATVLIGVSTLALVTGAEAITGVGARSTAPGWIALIRKNNGPTEDPLCSGVVVGNGYVLTAAHCTYDGSNPRAEKELRVTIGRASGGGKDYGVAKIHRAPGFVNRTRNDAALLQLHGISADDWDALPLAFEPSVVRQIGNVTLFGYGHYGLNMLKQPAGIGNLRESPEGAFQQFLQGCRDDLLCVRSASGSRIWSMPGDSGGPWLRRVSGAWQIVGLASRVHFQNGPNDQWIQDDPFDAAIATSTLATTPDAQSLVDWVRSVAALPTPPANTIVRNRFDGRSWLVGGDRYRRWIATSGDFECFRAQGSRVVDMAQPVINSIPDRVGTHAKCTTGVSQPDPNTGPGGVTPTDGPEPTSLVPTPTKIVAPSPTPPPSKRPTPVRSHGRIDFNRDGYSDFVIYAGGTWAVKSGRGPHDYIAQGVSLGKSSDAPFVGDFNGDGTPDFAIYSGGQWAVKSGAAPYHYVAQGIQLGGTGSTPVIGDFNGDGVTDFGTYTGGQWAVRSGKVPYAYVAQGIWLGKPESVPVVGDFNGDGYSDFGIYENGTWAVKSGQSPYSYVSQGIQLGGSGSTPLVGDVNGDGKSDYVIYSGGTWAVRSGATPYSYVAQGVSLGNSSAKPLLGDFNADGRVDYTIWENGTWAAKSSIDPNPYSAQGVKLGSPGEMPLTG